MMGLLCRLEAGGDFGARHGLLRSVGHILHCDDSVLQFAFAKDEDAGVFMRRHPVDAILQGRDRVAFPQKLPVAVAVVMFDCAPDIRLPRRRRYNKRGICGVPKCFP